MRIVDGILQQVEQLFPCLVCAALGSLDDDFICRLGPEVLLRPA